MKLYIKDMVCIRCKMIVMDELSKLGLHYTMVELGEAEITGNITDQQRTLIRKALLKYGLDLIEDKKSVLVQKIKNIIIELVRYSAEPLPIKFSVYLSQKLEYDYTYLSNIFSRIQGISIESYFISHKIERVKELLLYNEFTLSKIAEKMNYSSVAHLSAQFKKVTGLTSSEFRQTNHYNRFLLEDVGNTKRNEKASC